MGRAEGEVSSHRVSPWSQTLVGGACGVGRVRARGGVRVEARVRVHGEGRRETLEGVDQSGDDAVRLGAVHWRHISGGRLALIMGGC